MGKPVRSEFVSALDRGAAILRALSQDVADQGGDDTDLLRILTDEACRKDIAGRLVEHRQPQVTPPQFPCQRLVPELIPTYTDKDVCTRQWEVLEDVEPTFVDGCQLDFLKAWESSVNGDTMRARAKAKNAAPGLSDVKFVLANQHLIPEEMRDKDLVFAGTKLRDPDGHLRVPYLCWDDGRWQLYFLWLRGGFGGGYRLVARK